MPNEKLLQTPPLQTPPSRPTRTAPPDAPKFKKQLSIFGDQRPNCCRNLSALFDNMNTGQNAPSKQTTSNELDVIPLLKL